MNEETMDKYEVAFDAWRTGDKSESVQKTLLESGLNEYQDGKYSADIAKIVCEKAHNGETLTRMDRRTIKDLYEYLEDVNFHTEVEAIEAYTLVKYV